MPQKKALSDTTTLAVRDHGAIKAAIHALDVQDDIKNEIVSIINENNFLRRRDIRALGTDEIFIRTGDSGEMIQARFPLRLSFQKGELYTIDGIYHGFDEQDRSFWTKNKKKTSERLNPNDLTFHLTATGYWSIAKHAGIHVGDVTDPENDQDDESGIVTAIRQDLMAVGFDPIGNLRISRLRFIYRAMDEFLESLKKKEKYCEGIEMGVERDYIDNKTKRCKPGYTFQRLAKMGKDWIGYSCNLKNTEVRDLLGNIATLNKNAERKARTVGERLVLKSWTGIRQASPVYEDPSSGDIYTIIPITAWQKPVTKKHYEQVKDDIKAGREKTELKLDGNTITAEVVEAVADEKEIAKAADEETNLDDTFQAPNEDDEETTSSQPSGTTQSAISTTTVPAQDENMIRIQNAIKSFDSTYGKGETAQFLADYLGVDVEGILYNGASKATAAKILNEIENEILRREGRIHA